MTQNDTEARLAELEIQVALQNDLLDSLNDTIARLQQSLDLQQAQLRLLYGRLQEKDGSGANQAFNPAAELSVLSAARRLVLIFVNPLYRRGYLKNIKRFQVASCQLAHSFFYHSAFHFHHEESTSCPPESLSAAPPSLPASFTSPTAVPA